ncbi:MAG TPA: hypothetical protein GX726_04000 [Clostridiales bacterium]|jgi:hypothetical protein|nr:hypothetical protein [Clostridiales bacterium]
MERAYCNVCGNPLRDANYVCTVCGEKPYPEEGATPATASVPVDIKMETEREANSEPVADASFDKISEAELKTRENNRLEGIDRYFVFEKRNEEFQETLDEEYEKIKAEEWSPVIPAISRDSTDEIYSPPDAEAEDAEDDSVEAIPPITPARTAEATVADQKTEQQKLWFEQEYDDDVAEKRNGFRILVVVLIILLAVGLATIVGLSTVFPDTPAGQVVNSFLFNLLNR